MDHFLSTDHRDHKLSGFLTNLEGCLFIEHTKLLSYGALCTAMRCFQSEYNAECNYTSLDTYIGRYSFTMLFFFLVPDGVYRCYELYPLIKSSSIILVSALTKNVSH